MVIFHSYVRLPEVYLGKSGKRMETYVDFIGFGGLNNMEGLHCRISLDRISSESAGLLRQERKNGV